jgi:hypothetical protein
MSIVARLSARLTRGVEDVLVSASSLRQSPPPSPEEAGLAARLRSDLETIGREAHGAAQSDFWFDTCAELRLCADHGDPRNFMRWRPVAHTMAMRTIPATVGALKVLRRSPDWEDWSRVLRHPNVGGAPPFLPAPWTSAISVQHAAHLVHFRSFAGRDFDSSDVILDMGAGYGSMCRLVKARGSKGDYIIFDQPPVLALQRYFLGRHGIDADYGQISRHGVALCRDLDDLAALIRPGARVAVISTWAMSEMPLVVRRRIEPFLARANKILLAYQVEFSGLDNRAYFLELAGRLGDGIHHAEVPFYPRNFYVFADRG